MKIRRFFVANSSSSSFIVAFPSIPSSSEELQEMLFEDEPYIESWDEQLSTKSAAEIIFSDNQFHQGSSGLTFVELSSELSYDAMSYDSGFWSTLDRNAPDADQKIKEYYDECDALSNGYGTIQALKFLEENKGSTILKFTFHDNGDKDEGILENGNTFDRLPHIKISQH